MLEFLIKILLLTFIFLIVNLNKYTIRFVQFLVQTTSIYSWIKLPGKSPDETVAIIYKIFIMIIVIIGLLTTIIEELIKIFF